jgi:putative flippase GtrA
MIALPRRPLRYIVVGACNTAVSYGVYAFLLMLGLGLPLAGLLSLAAGILTGFLAQGRFVFGRVSYDSLVRFILAWALMYGVHLGIVTGLLSVGISPYVGALLALAVLPLLSYFVLRDFVFVPQTKSR